jgi:hypothetical protein
MKRMMHESEPVMLKHGDEIKENTKRMAGGMKAGKTYGAKGKLASKHSTEPVMMAERGEVKSNRDNRMSGDTPPSKGQHANKYGHHNVVNPHSHAHKLEHT